MLNWARSLALLCLGFNAGLEEPSPGQEMGQVCVIVWVYRLVKYFQLGFQFNLELISNESNNILLLDILAILFLLFPQFPEEGKAVNIEDSEPPAIDLVINLEHPLLDVLVLMDEDSQDGDQLFLGINTVHCFGQLEGTLLP